METLELNIAEPQEARRCSIYLGQGILQEALAEIAPERYTRIAVITDKNVQPLWSARFRQFLPGNPLEVVIPAGEQAKTIDTVTKVWGTLLDAGFDRHSLVLNLGGGLVGDLGGFAASTYMRGIDFVQVPTTLLAQVDASVGGKVGINFGEVKNVVGSFNQPRAVIIDVTTLETLPARERRAGFAEIIKHAAIRDRMHFEELAAHDFADAPLDEYVGLVRRSCQIKAEVVAADEKEGGLRKILNFGHTVGHAIEIHSQESKHPLLHGEAVALGMRVGAGLSARLGFLPETEYRALLELLERYRLPTRVPLPIDVDDVLAKTVADKKSWAGNVKWVLLAGIGSAVFDMRIDDDLVREALTEIL